MISLCWTRVNVLLDADYDELNTYQVLILGNDFPKRGIR